MASSYYRKLERNYKDFEFIDSWLPMCTNLKSLILDGDPYHEGDQKFYNLGMLLTLTKLDHLELKHSNVSD